MMKKLLMPIMITVFATLLLITTFTNNEKMNEIRTGASWVESFDTLKDMSKSSDLIIIGRVTNQEPEKRVDLVFTNQIITIDNIIKDKRSINTKDLSEIKVLQTGGVLGDEVSIPFNEAPLLENGKEYFLFLRETEEKRFLIMGGFVGDYEIVNGKLYCKNTDHKLKKEIKGKKPKDLIAEIDSILAE